MTPGEHYREFSRDLMETYEAEYDEPIDHGWWDQIEAEDRREEQENGPA